MLCFVRQAWTCLSTTLVENFVRRLVRWARRMKSNRVKCERGDRRAKVSPLTSSNKRRKSDYLRSTVQAKRCRSKVNDQWTKESFYLVSFHFQSFFGPVINSGSHICCYTLPVKIVSFLVTKLKWTTIHEIVHIIPSRFSCLLLDLFLPKTF